MVWMIDRQHACFPHFSKVANDPSTIDGTARDATVVGGTAEVREEVNDRTTVFDPCAVEIRVLMCLVWIVDGSVMNDRSIPFAIPKGSIMAINDR